MDHTRIFIDHVKSECKKHKIKLRLGRGSKVKHPTGDCGGYFDGVELAVAYYGLPKTRRLNILVHEYSHFCQWKENSPFWTNVNISTNEDALDIFGRWITHEIECDQDTLDEVFKIVIAMERDCDKRAVKIIKEFKLPIDIAKYKKEANAYHYFYHVCKEKRKWYSKPIYFERNVLKVMPSHFRGDVVNCISKDKFAAIARHM